MKSWQTVSRLRIVKLPNARCNCYLLVDGHNAVLVDTSVKRGRRKLLKAVYSVVAEHNCKLRAIVLTHSHFDHVGNAAFLSRRFKCDVLIHSSEYDDFLAGRTRLPAGVKLPQKWITQAIAWLNDKGKYLRLQRFEVPDTKRVVAIDDGLDLGSYGINASVIHTKGHTAGSVSVIAGDFALVGDAMVRTIAGNIFPPFADQPEGVVLSWQKLVATGCKTFLPAHGGEVSVEKVKNEILKRFR